MDQSLTDSLSGGVLDAESWAASAPTTRSTRLLRRPPSRATASPPCSPPARRCRSHLDAARIATLLDPVAYTGESANQAARARTVAAQIRED